MPLCCREASSFACAIMGDLHLEPGHQMALFEEARSQLVAAVTAPGVAAPRVVQLGEGGSGCRIACTWRCNQNAMHSFCGAPPALGPPWVTAA